MAVRKGAAIGYVKYSAAIIAKNCAVMSYLLLVIPLVALVSVRIFANQNYAKDVQTGALFQFVCC